MTAARLSNDEICKLMADVEIATVDEKVDLFAFSLAELLEAGRAIEQAAIKQKEQGK